MSRTINGSAGAWRRVRARILAASDVCHLCGHPGSDAVDHKVPLNRGGTNAPENLAPAHHTAPCPTCGIKCNRAKGDRPIAPVIRRSGALSTRPTTPPPPTDGDCGT